MTREEQITNEANIRYSGRISGTNDLAVIHASGLFEGFHDGAQWADQHPVNQWHDASKELPEMGGLYLVHNGRTCQTIRYNKEQNRWGVNPWMIVNVKYWMPIPEIGKED